MTLTEAIDLLETHRIPYQTARYENETDYYYHCMPLVKVKNARNCPVTALVIPSVNGEKDIELQFNRRRGVFLFEELWFGPFSFDLFDLEPEYLESDILELIGQIVDGKLAFITVVDTKRKRTVSDACYDLTDEDDVFGAPGFRAAVAKLREKKSIWHKLTGRKTRYDIYTWKTSRTHLK